MVLQITRTIALKNNPEYKQITFLDWLKLGISFRYLSNLSIFGSIISYYTNAYDFFFIFAPLLITNAILNIILIFYDLDEVVKGTFEELLPNEIDRNNIKVEFVIFNMVWHIIPLFWLYSILERDSLISSFRPNFMGIFLKSSIIPIIYYYYLGGMRIYGNVNDLKYFIMYIITLLGVCVFLYMR
jgi:hypothetical protein